MNKQGGGRDAFSKDAQRMGMMGTVDDDEGIAFQIGKNGLRKKTPKLRWNRFKWILFVANSVVSPMLCSGDPLLTLTAHFIRDRHAGLRDPGVAQHLSRCRCHQSGQQDRADS